MGSEKGAPQDGPKRRKKKTAGVDDRAPPAIDPPPPPGIGGRSASEWKDEEMEYLLDPWIARRTLTMMAGGPSTGKSTFVSSLMALATRPMLFPGKEERGGSMTKARMRRHGVNIGAVILMDDCDYSFPASKERVLATAMHYRCDLICLDPVDSYLPTGESPNDSVAVRDMLESLAEIAGISGAAVVCVKHPGKMAGNILPGSVQWEAVPRTVLEFIRNPGPPERRLIRAHKDNLGASPPPTYYELVGEAKQPRLWTWGGKVDETTVDEMRNETDSMERQKIDEAEEFLRHFLRSGQQEVKVVLYEAKKEGLGERTMRRAAARIAVERHREGSGKEHRSFWAMPKPTPATLAK